jgi:hypothetical protein
MRLLELPAKKKPVKPQKDGKCPIMQTLEDGKKIDIGSWQKTMMRMRTIRGQFENSEMFNSMGDSGFEKKKTSALIGISTTGQNTATLRRRGMQIEKTFLRQSRSMRCEKLPEVNAAQ